MDDSASISKAMKALACFSCLTLFANCADGLLRAEHFAELVPADVGVHHDCSLFHPSLKHCDANCDVLASFDFDAK